MNRISENHYVRDFGTYDVETDQANCGDDIFWILILKVRQRADCSPYLVKEIDRALVVRNYNLDASRSAIGQNVNVVILLPVHSPFHNRASGEGLRHLNSLTRPGGLQAPAVGHQIPTQ